MGFGFFPLAASQYLMWSEIILYGFLLGKKQSADLHLWEGIYVPNMTASLLSLDDADRILWVIINYFIDHIMKNHLKLPWLSILCYLRGVQ